MASSAASIRFDRAALNACLTRAKPTDVARGMYYNAALTVVRALGGEQHDLACRKQVGTKRYTDIFNYPVTEFLRIIEYIAEHFESGDGAVEAAYRRVGAEAGKVFLASATGKTLVFLTGGNVRVILSSTPAAYAAMVTFGSRKFTMLGERAGRMSFNDDLLAGCYHAAIAEVVYGAVHGSPIRVTHRQHDAFNSDCEMYW